MDISILAEFVRLVETCSFQETAAQMNISQSALTKHIHKLEEELDTTLFDRSQRTIGLNAYSQHFYPYAKQILRTYEEGLSSLHEMQNRDAASFTVAYHPLLGQYGIVDILSDFAARFPQHTMNSLESYSSLELLSCKKCDFAFVSEFEATPKDAAFNRMIFKVDTLCAVLPKEHPLAANHALTLRQLAGEKFILHSTLNSTPNDETSKFLELCRSQDFEPSIAIHSHFTSTMVQYVRNGKGIAILNRLHMPENAQDVAVIDLSPSVRTYLFLVYPQRIVTACARDFLHYMVEHCSP